MKIYWAIFCILITLTSSAPSQHFHFNFRSHMIPHPEKAHRGGQDAYFNSSSMLVVADGVGGWNNQGIDPSKYSRFLCTAAQRYLHQNKTKYTKSPLDVIIRAQTQNENIGSSTMVVVTLDQDKLRYCYIGGMKYDIIDSGFMLIRKYEKYISIFEFVEQQHSFNFPFQLALSQFGGDNPHLSICGQIQVEDGDIVVVGSDGLFDNIQFRQVQEQVQKAQRAGTLLSELPEKLAKLGITRGENPKFNSPFAQRAKQNKINYTGGKLDDTTVIIAKIELENHTITQL